MADYGLFHKVVKSLALGEGEKARELIEQIRDDEQREYAVYVAAAFTEVAGEYFEADHGLVAIKEFVDEATYAYRNAPQTFKPMAMEILIRALFFEDQSLAEVSGRDQLELQTMALRMVVHKSPEIYAQLDQHLTAAEALAAEWLSEDA